jgi:hypothetical protein
MDILTHTHTHTQNCCKVILQEALAFNRLNPSRQGGAWVSHNVLSPALAQEFLSGSTEGIGRYKRPDILPGTGGSHL